MTGTSEQRFASFVRLLQDNLGGEFLVERYGTRTHPQQGELWTVKVTRLHDNKQKYATTITTGKALLQVIDSAKQIKIAFK